MNKKDLVAHVAKSAGITTAQASAAIDALFHVDNGAIAKAVQNGEKFAISGFGSFAGTERPAREGRNPRTGKPVQIAASRGVRFAAGKSFKDRLNG